MSIPGVLRSTAITSVGVVTLVGEGRAMVSVPLEYVGAGVTPLRGQMVSVPHCGVSRMPDRVSATEEGSTRALYPWFTSVTNLSLCLPLCRSSMSLAAVGGWHSGQNIWVEEGR